MAERDYPSDYSNFKWPRPERFNFARDVVDRWAQRDPGKLALLWVDDEDREERRTFADVSAASCRVANLLQAAPKLDALWNHDDDQGIGVLAAIQQAGRSEFVMVGGAGLAIVMGIGSDAGSGTAAMCCTGSTTSFIGSSAGAGCGSSGAVVSTTSLSAALSGGFVARGTNTMA